MKAMSKTRWAITSRTFAGTLGAYGAISLFVAAFSRLLARIGVNPVEAVVIATLPSFALFAVLAITAFHARSATRAWSWITGAAILCGLLWLTVR